MGIIEHKNTFAGTPIQPWAEDPLKDPATTGYRITFDLNDREATWANDLGVFMSQPGVDQLRALVIGAVWENSEFGLTRAFVEALVMHRERLPNLRALFIGDATQEECEITWIRHDDLSAIFLAFPQLEHFGVRGVENLRFGLLDHAALRSFALESGGTPTHLIDEIKAAHLPALTDFELWTGHGEAWEGTLDDLRPILMGETFPHLTRLGICNSTITDEVVLTLVESPLYEQLQHLDLSRGSLTDEGARALLHHPHTKRLTSLDVRHHYCSTVFEAELTALKLHGVTVEIDKAVDRRKWGEGDHRYEAIGE